MKNKVYQKVERLNSLGSSDTYRKHIVADGLQDYIEKGKNTRFFLDLHDASPCWISCLSKEHKSSWKLLGHTRTEHPWEIIADAATTSSVFTEVLSRASGEMPQASVP